MCISTYSDVKRTKVHNTSDIYGGEIISLRKKNRGDIYGGEIISLR